MATTTTDQSIPNIEERHRIDRLANLTKLVDVELDLLKESFEEAKRRIDPVIAQINEARDKFNDLIQQNGGEMMMEMERELRELKQTTGNLKSKIPFNLITPEYQPASDPNVIFQPQTDPRKPTALVCDDDASVDNHPPPIPQDLDSYFPASTYHPNYDRSKVLRCFLAFPEGALIKASLLWSYMNATLFVVLGVAFYSLEDVLLTASKLVSEGFIKSIYKKHSSTSVYGFWMDPLVRRTIQDRLPREVDYSRLSLVKSNINGEIIIYSGSADMPSDLQFLHLGKWQRSPTHHNIEMPDPNVYFKHTVLSRLTYISFRGVSLMKELPDFITELRHLRILDLKACHHLEVLPSNIGNLWCWFVHLDMSECYFLDHMPTSLYQLAGIRVLKGFFVGETSNNEEKSCTLQDLSHMELLVKLNIYTSLKTFPSVDHLTILAGFSRLRNLTICWGACPSRKENPPSRPKKSPAISLKNLVRRDSDPIVEVQNFSFNLEKLDLRGAPENGTPNWLRPSNFKKLEKLYIRGGQLSHLRHNDDAQKDKQSAIVKEKGWSVKILRLRHLSRLHMGWSELQESFPNVVSVEKVECPNLTSFPCDEDGLWRKETSQPPADGSERHGFSSDRREPVEHEDTAAEGSERHGISSNQRGPVEECEDPTSFEIVDQTIEGLSLFLYWFRLRMYNAILTANATE